MKNILAFDVGTTSMKCILYDEKFAELYKDNIEYSVETKDGIYAEVSADVYFKSFKACISSILKQGYKNETIAAVCFTTQGETLIPVDKCGNPLSKAIVWLDTRAGQEAQEIKKEISAEEFYKTTGLCDIDGAVPVAKVLHIKNNNPNLYNKTYKFLLLEDYLVYMLTGLFVSEKSLQSSTGWYDICKDRFYDNVLEHCGIDKSKFPDVKECGSVAGCVTANSAQITGLSESTLVVLGAMDQIASAIGAGNVKEGIVTETTGTALVVGATVKKPEFNLSNPVTVYKHYNNMYIYIPYFATAGITHKWFRDTFMPNTKEESKKLGISSYTVIEEIARLSPPGSNGVIFDPDFTLGGGINGITLSTSISDIARSVQEGIAYVLRELIESVETKGVNVSTIYSVGGGSYSDFWLGIKSSVCNKKIVAPVYSETTALGAAILASVAVGIYKDVPDALSCIDGKPRTFLPIETDVQIYNKCYKKYKQIKRR